jgi:hypothetical protein
MDIILALVTMVVVLIVPAVIVAGLVAAPDKSRLSSRVAAGTQETSEEHTG